MRNHLVFRKMLIKFQKNVSQGVKQLSINTSRLQSGIYIVTYLSFGSYRYA